MVAAPTFFPYSMIDNGRRICIAHSIVFQFVLRLRYVEQISNKFRTAYIIKDFATNINFFFLECTLNVVSACVYG